MCFDCNEKENVEKVDKDGKVLHAETAVGECHCIVNYKGDADPPTACVPRIPYEFAPVGTCNAAGKYWKSDKSCADCAGLCTSCLNGDPNSCFTCKAKSHFVARVGLCEDRDFTAGQCVCDEGTYLNGAGDACTDCTDAACLVCNALGCLQCMPEFELKNGACACRTGHTKSGTDCNEDDAPVCNTPGEFPLIANDNSSCVSCADDCNSCTDRDASQCLTCSDPAKVNEKSATFVAPGRCVCPPGTY
jgi:hypothetical protein